MTNREIDEAVARELGWTHAINSLWYPPNPPIPERPSAFQLPAYSSDIAAAWEIAERIPHVTLYHADVYHARWKVSWLGISGVEYVGADTAPMAICLALLKLQESQPLQGVTAPL